MNWDERITRTWQRMGPDGDCNPVCRQNFGEAVLWADSQQWSAIERAYHSGDDAEFGRLVRQVAFDHWYREAQLCA